MLNDNPKMHWGYSVFEQAAAKLIKIAEKSETLKGLDKNFFDKVDAVIAPTTGSDSPIHSLFLASLIC